MKIMTESELRASVIFGDNISDEYVYMPASELGVENPICVYEYSLQREDVQMAEALDIIRRRSLKPVKHPRLGESSC